MGNDPTRPNLWRLRLNLATGVPYSRNSEWVGSICTELLHKECCRFPNLNSDGKSLLLTSHRLLWPPEWQEAHPLLRDELCVFLR